jgi:hypothetical protein
MCFLLFSSGVYYFLLHERQFLFRTNAQGKLYFVRVNNEDYGNAIPLVTKRSNMIFFQIEFSANSIDDNDAVTPSSV